jgi:hypothetical protein
MIHVFRSKRAGVLMGGILLFVATTSVALAEGYTHLNSLNDAPRGWETGTFTDYASDNANSRMVFFAHCDDQHAGTTDANEKARIQLLRHAGIFPWEVRGDVTQVCGNTNAVWNYGIQPGPAEVHKWKIVDFSPLGGSGNTLDVPANGLRWYW